MSNYYNQIKSFAISRLKVILIFWYLVDILSSNIIPVLKAVSLIVFTGIKAKKSYVQFLTLSVLISLLTSDLQNLVYMFRIYFFLFVIIVLNDKFKTYSLDLLRTGVVLMTYLSFGVLLLGFLVSDPLYGDTRGLSGGSRGLVESGNQIFWMNFFLYLSNKSLDRVYKNHFSLASFISVVSFFLIQTKLSLLLFIFGVIRMIRWWMIMLIPVAHYLLRDYLFLSSLKELSVLKLLIYKLENENILSAITNNRYDKWLGFKLHVLPSNSYFNFESTILNVLSNAGLLVTFFMVIMLFNLMKGARLMLKDLFAIVLFSSLGGHLEEAVISVFAIVSYLSLQRYIDISNEQS